MYKLKGLAIGILDQVGGIISNILNRKGFDVTVVDSSRSIKETYMEIRAELSRGKYDLVLLTNNGLRPSDIRVLIPEIKRKYPGIKIIVLSGWNTPKFIRDLKEQGIDGFLTLPFAHDDLVQKVTSIFKFDEENEIKEVQKKLNWATLSYRKNFGCEVISYDGYDYRVRFSRRGKLIAIESISRKEIDDLKIGVKRFPYLEELFGWIRQVAEGTGKS
jgi:CheY-like chemotaxis protein